MVDHRRRESEAARARGEPVAGSGPALGLRELKWLKPVYVGDTIVYKTEVHRDARLGKPARPRADDSALDRRQSERRHGDLVRHDHLRRAPAAEAMTMIERGQRNQERRAPRHRRRLRGARAARRLYRSHLCDAADLAERVRARLRRARTDEDRLLRHARRLADSLRLRRRTFRHGGGARARHRAGGARLLFRGPEHRHRHADRRAVRRRIGREHAASAGVLADRAGVLGRAVARGARHL